MHRIRSWLRNPTLAYAARFNVYTVALTVLWTPLGTVLLQQRVSDLTSPGLRDAALGIVTFAGITVAAVTQPIAGWISDQAPLGDRRRPFIVGGTLLDILFLLYFWWSPTYGWLFGAYVLLQLSSNFAQAAFQALIPDLVGPRDLGLASGVKNGYDLLGSILGLAGVGLLLGAGAGLGAALLFIAVVLILGAGLSIRWVPRVPPLPPEERMGTLWGLARPGVVLGALALDLRVHGAFALAAASRFLFLLGMFPAQRFFLYFAETRYAAGAATEITSYYFLALILIGAAAAAGSGALSDRFGRVNILRVGMTVAAAGLLGVALSPSLTVLLAPGAVLAVGLGTFQAVNWALLADFIPRGQEARFYGLSNLATAGASALAGLFGLLITGLSGVTPTDVYQIAFIIAAALALTGLVPLQWIPGGRSGDPAE